MRYLNISFLRKMGGQIDELVSVSKRVTTSDMNNANVIIDFADKKVVKCVIEGKEHNRTFDQLYEYYSKIYPQLIKQLETEAEITKMQEQQVSKLAKIKK